MAVAIGRITAYEDTIARLYDPQEYVGRSWLVEQVAQCRDNKERRHLIIVGEPGSGKSTFLAYLAATWNCPRFFIRVDSKVGVTGNDLRGFAISLGAQLYQKYGRGIFPQELSGSTEVRTGLTAGHALVIGRVIDRLYRLPFLPMTSREVRVWADVTTDGAQVFGERIEEVHNIAESLPATTLLKVAFLDPIKRLAELVPNERVVILVDALDEAGKLPDPDGSGIAGLIPRVHDADYPANLCIVMTSRSGSQLATFRADDLLRLDDPAKGFLTEGRKDARAYIDLKFSQGALAGALAALSAEKADRLVTEVEAMSRADQEGGSNNFLYLYHFFREVASEINRGKALDAIAIPKGLDEIYRFFAVKKIKAEADLHYWVEFYLPVLGVLAVISEPVGREQLCGFAGVAVEYVDFIVSKLEQFLYFDATAEGERRYRFFHPSFSDYLLDVERNHEYPLNGPEYHRRIWNYYRAGQPSWSRVSWEHTTSDYPFRHLVSHLLRSGHAKEVYALIDRTWFDAKFARFGSPASFLQDLGVALQTAGAEQPVNIPEEVYACLLHVALATPSDYPWPQLVVALAEVGGVARALEFADLMADRQKRVEALCGIAEAMLSQGASADDVARVLEYAEDSIEGTRESAEDWLRERMERIVELSARTFTERHDLQGGWRIVESLSTYEARRPVIQAIVQELSRRGEVAEALRLLGENLHPDAKRDYIGAIVGALLDVGNLEQAYGLAVALEPGYERGHALGELARAFRRAGRQDRAREAARHLWEQAKADRAHGPPWILRYVPAALAAGGQVEDAWAVAKSLEDPTQKAMALDLLSTVLTNVGDLEGAARVVDWLVDIGDEVYCTAGAARLASSFAGVGQVVRARTLANGPCRNRSEVLAAAAEGATSNSRFDDALAFIAEVSDLRRRCSSLEDIVCRIAEAGHDEQALSAAEMYGDATARQYARRCIARAHAARGDVGGALAATNPGAEPSATVEEIASILVAAADSASAQDLQDLTRRIIDVLPRTGETRYGPSIVESVRILQRRELQSEARKLALAALETAKAEPIQSRVRELADLAKAFLLVGEPHVMENEITRQLRRLPPLTRHAFATNDTRQDLARSLARWGGRARADDAAIKGPGMQSAVVLGLAQAGTFGEALDLIDCVEDREEREQTKRALAEFLAHQGTLGQALDVIDGIEDSDQRRRGRKEVLITAAQSVNVDSTSGISDPLWRGFAQRRLAVGLARQGSFDQARIAAERVSPKAERALALIEIAVQYATRPGSPHEAIATLVTGLDLFESADSWDTTVTDAAILDATSRALGHIIRFGHREAAGSLVQRFGPDRRLTLLEKVAADLAASGAWGEGVELVLGLSDAHAIPPVVQAFVRAAKRAGDATMAAQTVLAAASRLDVLAGASDHVALSRELAPSLARIGQWQRAIDSTFPSGFSWPPAPRSLGSLGSSDQFFVDQGREDALCRVAVESAELGDLDRAVRTIGYMTTSQGIENAFFRLALVSAARGDVSRMQQMLEMRTDSDRPYAGATVSNPVDSSLKSVVAAPMDILPALPDLWRALASAGKTDEAIGVFRGGCARAAYIDLDRDALLALIEQAVELLAEYDNGATLLAVFHATRRADGFGEVTADL